MLRYHQRLLDLERQRRQTGVRVAKAYRDAIVAGALAGQMPSLIGLSLQQRAAVEAAFRASS